ncbi:uncharacterized protein LOC125025145 [Penaeus chinensis]|uniref:uncharacterized protein LOC125025145 n=1 Tax=Penaeus chinensis TaxID=139456 RepID=UPI001FB59E8E|nr:uncharacterized protein LOC125025145 [Penaeus chinensis]
MKKAWKAAMLIALILPTAVNSSSVIFKKVFEGRRGTNVIFKQIIFAITTCAFKCASVLECRGFNWQKTSGVCEGLSFLTSIEATDSYMFYRDMDYYWHLLEYTCPTCTGPNWGRYDWIHDCKHGIDMVVGIAVKASLDDLDYMQCGSYYGVLMNTDIGAASPGSNIFSCAEFFDQKGAVIGLWSNEQFFNAPTSVENHCRLIITGELINTTQCETPRPTPGTIPIAGNTVYQLMQCSFGMVATNVYRKADGSFEIICCALSF